MLTGILLLCEALPRAAFGIVAGEFGLTAPEAIFCRARFLRSRPVIAMLPNEKKERQ